MLLTYLSTWSLQVNIFVTWLFEDWISYYKAQFSFILFKYSDLHKTSLQIYCKPLWWTYTRVEKKILATWLVDTYKNAHAFIITPRTYGSIVCWQLGPVWHREHHVPQLAKPWHDLALGKISSLWRLGGAIILLPLQFGLIQLCPCFSHSYDAV